ncbi:MAG TPA: protein kinase [Pseudomonadales bacterium]
MAADLAEALRRFHDGAASETAVMACLDSILAESDCDPDTLLTVIDEHHTRRPLPETLVRRLRERVQEAARVLATGSREHVDATRLATGFAGTGERRMPAGDPDSPDATRLYSSSSNRGFGEPVAKVGDTLNGRFYLEELIGEGGMSLVFRAIDRLREKAQSRNPYVALKVLDVAGPSEREAFIALQREAQKSQTLNHPSIVRVHDFHQDGDIVYMTMEYLHGVPLSVRLKQMGQRGLPTARALKYVRQMGEALIHPHGHRSAVRPPRPRATRI